MNFEPFIGSRIALLTALLMAVIVTGCQTYSPDPLDLESHAEEWRARSPSSEQVREFAARIPEARPEDAVDYDPTEGLSMPEGEIVALVFNPDLRMARLRAGVAKAAAEHAGLWDNPNLSVDILRVIESVPDPWVVGSAFSITLPISGRLGAEKARAEAAMSAELERVAEAEWNTRRDVRESWFAWSAQRLKARETQAIVRGLDSVIESVTKLAEAGELLRTEASLFLIEREARRAELERMRGDADEKEQEIRSLLGLAPEAVLRLVSETFSNQPGPLSGNEPDENHPTLARLRAEYDVAESELRREIRKQYPDLTIGPQAESDEGQSRVGFAGAIPLPILNSNLGGIATARARREAARAAFETEYERMAGRIAASRARLQGALSLRDRIDESLAPLVDRQVRDARRLVELGEGGTLVLLESLLREYDAKLKRVDSEYEIARLGNEIRFLLGPSREP